MIKPYSVFSIIFVVILCLLFCSKKSEKSPEIGEYVSPQETVVLWNGENFNNWNFFLSDSNVNPQTVWSIKDGNLFCKGVPNGYIKTKERYTNYKLVLEWRWTDEPGNSGVLLHVQERDEIWPVSIEGQLKTGNAGDILLIGGTEVKEQTDKSSRRILKQQDSSEKSPGNWNHYQITCKSDSIKLKINGVLQNSVSGASVTSGYIALQSEGKPIEFRNIKLEPLE